MSSTMYDVCVVGAGMIGSAAARYMAQMAPHCTVCLIGPPEPKDKSAYMDQGILGAWYDEARMCRQLYTHPAWATISKRAAASYRDLERQSGIDFFHEVGCITVMDPGSEYQQLHQTMADQISITVQKLTTEQARDSYPYLDCSRDDVWLEPRATGYINPRLMVKAEQTVAKKFNCTIIKDIATSVKQVKQENGDGTCMEISTDSSGKVLARKVLLATGAFTEFKDLLPAGIVPDVSIISNTVVLAELSHEDQIRMKNMPSLLYNGSGHKVDGSNYLYTYILPPVQYPDGKVYLKIGHMNIPGTYKYLDTLDEINDHYRSRGMKTAVDLLIKIMNKLFPDFRPVSIHSDSCVTTHSAPGLPYIDLLHSQLGVAIAGNGAAGKACDELGKMAALLMLSGEWKSDLPAQWFKFIQRGQEEKKGELTYAKL